MIIFQKHSIYQFTSVSKMALKVSSIISDAIIKKADCFMILISYSNCCPETEGKCIFVVTISENISKYRFFVQNIL